MKLRQAIDRGLYIALASLMGLMVANVLWQVASRYLLNAPSSFTDELARFLLIWIGLLGAAYVTGKKLHLAVDIVPNKLTGSKQKNLSVFINILVSLFSVLVLIWGGINLVYITLTLKQTSTALGIQLGYVYLVLPLSGLLIVYYSITNLFKKLETPQEQGEEMV